MRTPPKPQPSLPTRDDLRPDIDVDLDRDRLELPSDLGDIQDTLEQAEQARQARENLNHIEHIVVLILENRSFDHMLGYLSLPIAMKGRARTDVNGLKGDEFNLRPGYLTSASAGLVGTAADPRRRNVFRLDTTIFPVDPRHSPSSVSEQMAPSGAFAMDGFVKNFEKELRDHGQSDTYDPGLIMGYHTGDQVPVYDLLSEHFTICDRWFSSMPGPTWPNRMFLYCGTSNGIINNPQSVANYGPEYTHMPERLIIDALDEYAVDWRIYSHDFAWMRLFRSFDPGPALTSRVDKFATFLRRCTQGQLPPVSFIDPNFCDIGNEANINDDHPIEADIMNGQRLVGQIYDALRTGANKLFERTLFIVTYDEHGGFYDHVPPPPAPDYVPAYQHYLKTYGVRVPALVASPWTPKRSVSSKLFDHTSILKTILLRFCDQAAINSMGPRVVSANHLGWLLSEKQARTDFPAANSVLPVRRAMPMGRPPLGRLSDLAQEIEQARAIALARGVPEEHL